MIADRELVVEVLRRMRESEQLARTPGMCDSLRAAWLARARAFDEVYTELKGRGYDARSY